MLSQCCHVEYAAGANRPALSKSVLLALLQQYLLLGKETSSDLAFTSAGGPIPFDYFGVSHRQNENDPSQSSYVISAGKISLIQLNAKVQSCHKSSKVACIKAALRLQKIIIIFFNYC